MFSVVTCSKTNRLVFTSGPYDIEIPKEKSAKYSFHFRLSFELVSLTFIDRFQEHPERDVKSKQNIIFDLFCRIPRARTARVRRASNDPNTINVCRPHDVCPPGTRRQRKSIVARRRRRPAIKTRFFRHFSPFETGAAIRGNLDRALGSRPTYDAYNTYVVSPPSTRPHFHDRKPPVVAGDSPTGRIRRPSSGRKTRRKLANKHNMTLSSDMPAVRYPNSWRTGRGTRASSGCKCP